jgi:hypothetical protein
LRRAHMWEEVDYSHKCVALLVCNTTERPELIENLLKLRCRSGIMLLELNSSFSRRTVRRAEMLLMKSNGGSRLIYKGSQ